MRLRTWLAALVVALALTGAVLFLVRQNLEQADRYASVAAFLLALLVAGVTAVAALRRRGSPPSGGLPSGAGESRGSRWSFAPLFAWRNGVVIKGGERDTHAEIHVNHDPDRG